ncbi:MAG: endolytic transglycosylase MltG [Actinomycetota bacterium]|nr:endolytic transglycosylase MltG [Acidobacteriota bacterium]MCL6094024.1 endolytic transglycosylase MltG [Actinomycetota bacterium]MDA8166551.1 endolytic transglycosylase MltG [Actinomycetota bacterium]
MKRRPKSSPMRRYGLLAAGAIVILVFAVAMSTHGSRPKVGVAEIHIAPGTSAADIARMLVDNNVIDSADDFMQKAQDEGAAADLKAGTYRLRRGEPIGNIIADLRQGKQAADKVLTVPEGFDIADIAGLLASKTAISAPAYGAAAAVNGRQLPLPGAGKAPSLEGFLFPSTYNLDEDTDAAALVKQQLEVFRENTGGLDWSGAAGQRTAPANLTPYQILIVASMVEREARVPEERPLVAAVIYNRLKSGMKLEVDATVQYAIGAWKKDLTEQDLQTDSPYNTRLYAGLPPGPICNPGLASIQAALQPAAVNYLYYVATGDAAGHHFFTDSYDAFLREKRSR